MRPPRPRIISSSWSGVMPTRTATPNRKSTTNAPSSTRKHKGVVDSTSGRSSPVVSMRSPSNKALTVTRRLLWVNSRERLLAVFSLGDLIVGRGKHVANDLATIRLVLHHQYTLAHVGSTCRSTMTGSVKANVSRAVKRDKARRIAGPHLLPGSVVIEQMLRYSLIAIV